MSTIGNQVLTLMDHAKRVDPSGDIADIVEMLSQTNEILDDSLWAEGNMTQGNRTTVRTGLPSVFWRLLNRGVQPSKSTTAQFDDQCGMLEAWCEIDKKLVDMAAQPEEFRLSEAQAFIEAMNQEFAQTLFYGNQGTAPEEFTGLAIRYSSLSASVANSQNIVSGGGSGSDNSSIWLVVWGANSAFCMFPKGSKAGLQHEDLGVVTVETTNGIGGSRMRAYQDRWTWDCGFVLKDWRYVVRIPNIDISNLVSKSSAADLIELMIKAIHRVPNIRMGKPVFYMNRSCFEMLDIQRRDDVISGGQLKYSEVDGVLTPTFRGIPIRICDQLLETEAVVS